MNDKYADNKTCWPVGSLVIHRADAKRREMLMKVEGYTKTGLCRTRYAEANRTNGGRREVWENDIAHLLDPQLFDLSNPADQPRGPVLPNTE